MLAPRWFFTLFPCKKALCVDPVPLKLFGEGNYAITDIQDVSVSEEFLGLDTATRGCHRNSELEDCETKTYLGKMKDKCGCITNNLMRFFPEENVGLYSYIYIYRACQICIVTKVETCTGEALWCLASIRVTEEDCPNKCEGLIVGVRKDPVSRLHKVQTSVRRVYYQTRPFTRT